MTLKNNNNNNNKMLPRLAHLFGNQSDCGKTLQKLKSCFSPVKHPARRWLELEFYFISSCQSCFGIRRKQRQKREPLPQILYTKTYRHGAYCLLTLFISPLVNVHLDQAGWKSKATSRRMQLYGLNDSNWGTSRLAVVTVRIGSALFSSSSCDSWEVISHFIATPAPTQQVKQTW